jgi:hypothetical protein
MASRLELDPASARAGLSRLAALVDELTSAAARVRAIVVDPVAAARTALAVASYPDPGLPPPGPGWPPPDPALAARRDELASDIGRVAVDLALTVAELRRHIERVCAHDAQAAADAAALRARLGDGAAR